MPELEAKMRIPPNTSNTTTSGINHHFFSCRANKRNSFNKRHMASCKLESALWGWQDQRLAWSPGFSRCELTASCASGGFLVYIEGQDRLKPGLRTNGLTLF